eukprot:1752118-Pyramimonas_sp.AAC.1
MSSTCQAHVKHMSSTCQAHVKHMGTSELESTTSVPIRAPYSTATVCVPCERLVDCARRSRRVATPREETRLGFSRGVSRSSTGAVGSLADRYGRITYSRLGLARTVAPSIHRVDTS